MESSNIDFTTYIINTNIIKEVLDYINTHNLSLLFNIKKYFDITF